MTVNHNDIEYDVALFGDDIDDQSGAIRFPLGLRFVVMIVVFAIVLSSIITASNYFAFRVSMVEKYTERASSISRLAGQFVDWDRIDHYLTTNEIDEEYSTTLAALQNLERQTGALYICVIRVSSDGMMTYIWDADLSADAYKLGHSYNAYEAYDTASGKENVAAMARGESGFQHLPEFDDTPELIGSFVPFHGSDGAVKGLVITEFSFANVTAEQHRYLLKIILVEIAVTTLMCLTYLLLLRRAVILPVNKLAKVADEFLTQSHSSTQSDQILDIFGKLELKNQDELKVLTVALKSMEKKINSHIKKLNIANEKATTDALTGLRNREFFYQRIDEYLLALSSGTTDSKESFAFIMIDVDFFKTVNDVYGHNEGDRVLSEFALALRAVFRETDTLARMGGDEFAVFCEDLPNKNIISNKLTTLQSLLSNIELRKNDQSRKVTASIGVFFSSNPQANYQTLYECADMALYKVKERGRNGFEIFTDNDIPTIAQSEKRPPLTPPGAETDSANL